MRRLLAIPFIWLLLPLVAAIVVIYYCFPTLLFPQEPEWLGKQAVYKVSLLTAAEKHGNWYRTEVKMLQSIDTLATDINGQVLLYIAADSISDRLQQGDILLVSTTPHHSNRGNPAEFDYDRYLLHQGISAVAFVRSGSWQQVGHRRSYSLRATADRCRATITGLYEQYGISGAELGVLSALTIGERNRLEPQTRRDYQAAGAMHILAVSGLHTGIVYGAFYLLLTLFGLFPVMYHQTKRKIINALTLILLLWLYAFLTGLSPSVVRAALMLSLYLTGKAADRQCDTYNIIFASAFITLCIEPLALFSISFQLSYAAVLAIVYFQPKLASLIHFRTKSVRWLWDLFCVSLAAQAGTIPVTLWYFCQTSNYFALTNFIVIPAATVIIYTTLFFFLLTPLPTLAGAVAWFLNKEVELLNSAVSHIESLPKSTTCCSLTTPMLIMLVALLLSAALYLHRHQWHWLIPTACCALLVVVFHLIHISQISQTDKLIVYNNPVTTLLQQRGRDCLILTDSLPTAEMLTENYRRQQMMHEPSYKDLSQQSAYSFEYKEMTFMIIKDSLLHRQSLTEEIRCNHLLLATNVFQPQIWEKLQADTVWLMPSMSGWKQEKVKHLLDSIQIPCVAVSDNKAKTW